MELENVKYDAFISYRHSPVDMYIAKSIHRRLENFKLPKSVIEKKLCEKTKINRVFRDQDELPLADNLSDPIDNALSNTEFLIVICTPRLPQSKWCLKEINTFLEKHDRDHILVVLAEGEPEESFPYELTHEKITTVDANGNTVEEEREIEPLAADVRGKNKRETEKLLDDATLRLCAAVFGLNYDDLKQRHKEQQNKRRIKIAVGVAAVSLAFAVVCLFLFAKIKVQNNQILEQNEQITQQNEQITEQNDTISKQYDEIQEKYQSAMVSCASELFDKGRRKDALYALTTGVEEDEISADTAYMLSNVLYAYDAGEGYYASANYENAYGVQDTTVSTDGRYLASLDGKGSIIVFDTENDEKVSSIANAIDDVSVDYIMALGTEYLYYVSEDGLHKFDFTNCNDEIVGSSDAQIWTGKHSGVFSLDAGSMTYFGEDGSVNYTISFMKYLEDGEDSFPYSCVEDYAFSSDGSTLVVLAYLDFIDSPYVFVIDVPSGNVRAAFETSDAMSSCVATSNDTLFVAQSNSWGMGSNIYAVDIDTVTQYWYSNISENTIYDLNYDENNIGLIANNSKDIVVLNALDGEILIEDAIGVSISDSPNILKVFAGNGQVNFFTDDGSRYVLSYDTNMFFDITFFTYIASPPTGEKITEVVGGNSNLFFSVNHLNYVLKYTYTSLGEKISDISQAEYEEMTAYKGINLKDREYNVRDAVQSADEEYVFTLYDDRSIIITDKSGKTINTIYNFESDLSDVERIDDLGVYIIHSYSYSYLLDKDMNIVAKMRRYVKFEDDYFYITTGSALYKVPYASPEELLKQAREEIGDYECDEATKARYGIR